MKSKDLGVLAWRGGRRLCACGAALLGLWAVAACVTPNGEGSGVVPFLDGAVYGAAPAGYCVNRAASQEMADQAIVLIGKCSKGSAQAPALIAISFGPPGSSAVLRDGAQALSDYFRSVPGRKALARDGRVGSVTITKASLRDGALHLRITDRTVGSYQRAFLALKGRLVTVSVQPPEGATITPEEGQRVLDATLAAVRRANAV